MSLDGGRIVVSASGKVGTQPELLVDAIKEADPMSKAAKQQAAGTVRRQLCAALSLSLSLAAHLPGVVFGRLAPFPSERLTLLFFRHLPACLPSRKSQCGQRHELQQ